jgi:hypothetical protein
MKSTLRGMTVFLLGVGLCVFACLVGHAETLVTDFVVDIPYNVTLLEEGCLNEPIAVSATIRVSVHQVRNENTMNTTAHSINLTIQETALPESYAVGLNTGIRYTVDLKTILRSKFDADGPTFTALSFRDTMTLNAAGVPSITITFTGKLSTAGYLIEDSKVVCK